MKTIITLIIIFLANSLYAGEKLYIALDNELPSKILKLELTRDWLSGKMLPDNESLVDLCVLNDKAKQLREQIVFITRFDKDYPFRAKYPQYKLENNSDSKWRELPEQAFDDSSWPLMTVRAINFNCRNEHHDREWEVECKRLDSFALQVYVFNIFDWAHRYEIKAIQNMAIFHSWTHLRKIENTYGNMPGFPVYIEPKYPSRPQIAMPWETNFSNRWQDNANYSRRVGLYP